MFGNFIPLNKEATKKVLKEAAEKSAKEPRSGGLIIPKSNCCNAPLLRTSGGVIMEYCSKCRKFHRELTYKE